MRTRRSAPPITSVVRPGTEAWSGGDGQVGVLLCHGFTGSTASLRPWASDLLERGYRVSLPRLPGHGTSWQELNTTNWQQWYHEVERAFTELHQNCQLVFVAGLSMGGALALRLAEVHREQVAGLVLVNPAVALNNPLLRALPVLKRLVPSIAAISGDIARPGADEVAYARTPLRALASMLELWQVVRSELALVDQPILFLRSVHDHVVDPSSAEMIFSKIRSTDVRALLLTRSYHVATLDYEADLIFTETADFLNRHTR